MKELYIHDFSWEISFFTWTFEANIVVYTYKKSELFFSQLNTAVYHAISAEISQNTSIWTDTKILQHKGDFMGTNDTYTKDYMS